MDEGWGEINNVCNRKIISNNQYQTTQTILVCSIIGEPIFDKMSNSTICEKCKCCNTPVTSHKAINTLYYYS